MRKLAVLVLTVAALAAGCAKVATPAGVQVAAGVPSSLTIVRIDRTPYVRRWTFVRAVLDPALVARLYNELRALPRAPIGDHCTVGFFVTYRLRFTFGRHGGAVVATADPSGCAVVTVSGGAARWAAVGIGPAFLANVRRAAGVSACDFTGQAEASRPPPCQPLDR